MPNKNNEVDRVWIFIAYNNGIPYFSKLFNDHTQLKEFSAIHSSKSNSSEYSSTYLDLTDKEFITKAKEDARVEAREIIFGEIEQFKSEVVTMDYCDDFKDGIYATIEHILSMPVFDSVLNHSELDQHINSIFKEQYERQEVLFLVSKLVTV